MSIEAATTDYWKKFVGEQWFNFWYRYDFGKSAPYKDIYNHFGLTTDNILKNKRND